VLKKVLTACNKLPAFEGAIFRGVKLSLVSEYPDSRKVVWWPFTSCTRNGDVLTNPQFLGPTGDRTIFCLETKSGRDIRRYSAYAAEDEILLLPGVALEVRAHIKIPGSAGLHMVTVRERDVPFQLIQ
jgi:hypothetical protein